MSKTETNGDSPEDKKKDKLKKMVIKVKVKMKLPIVGGEDGEDKETKFKIKK